MERASVLAGVQNMRAVDEHDLALLRSRHGHGHNTLTGTRESLAEELSRTHVSENAPVSKVVRAADLRTSREHDPNKSCGISLAEHRVFFIIAVDVRTKAVEHLHEIRFDYSFKQRARL